MSLKIRRNSYLWHETGNFFWSDFSNVLYVNFDVCSTAFVLHLLNGVPFSNFVFIGDYCTPLSLDGFPNATSLLSLSFCTAKLKMKLDTINTVMKLYGKHMLILRNNKFKPTKKTGKVVID